MPSGSEDGAFDRDEDVLVGSAQMRVVGIYICIYIYIYICVYICISARSSEQQPNTHLYVRAWI